MKVNDLTILQRVRLECLWCLCRFFAILPHWFRYYVVENIVFLIIYLIRYRVSVVKSNLRNSFPEKSDKELKVIKHKFYWTLAEIFVHSVSMAGLGGNKAKDVIEITNAEEHSKAVKGKDWIAMSAHFGCWEYIAFWGMFDPAQRVVSVYHPLHNPIMEIVYQRFRSRAYTNPVPMREFVRYYMTHKNKPLDERSLMLGLVADQNPPKRPNSHWFKFLNQDTIFFDGGEKLALKYNLPIYFTTMKRVSRGRYQLLFEQIYDGVEAVSENVITERYVRILEAKIIENPELWIWSHRRWKHKK